MLLCCLAATGAALAAADAGRQGAPRMDFTPLPAGSYRLPPIQPVGDAELLDERGRAVHLSTLTAGQDHTADLLLYLLRGSARLPVCARDPRAAARPRPRRSRRWRATCASWGSRCDPTSDTPAVISDYAASFSADARFEWRFLTAASVAKLLPVLEDLGQDVSVDTDAHGRPTRTLHHMLKVFLIDARGRVREIYTLSFIQPEVMFNDMRTLYLESHARR